MENKEIIINGVDVSGCEYCLKMTKYRCTIQRDVYKCLCKENPNCYYKQLKRKEQEYEELRQYHNKCCEDNAKKLEEWLEKYNQVSRDFYNGKHCNKENCSLLKAKEQKLAKMRQILNVYYDDDWKATREIERILDEKDK